MTGRHRGIHRAPSRQTRRLTAGLGAALAALVLVTGALSLSRHPQPQMAPVDLVLPSGAPAEIGQWCVDHNTSEFRATLSNAGRNLLKGCVELWGGGLTPSPSPSSSPSPSVSPSPSPTVSSSPSPSPTVSPSPSPTPSPTSTATGCLTQPSRCGFPDATNTGAKGTLTPVSGDVKLSTAGQVYTDREVTGCITVTAPNVTIRNVKVHCSGYWGIEYYGPTSGTLTIQDTTVDCGTNHRGTAIDDSTPSSSSAKLVILRVDAGRDCENAFSLWHDTVIQDSWCHDLTPEIVNGTETGAHVDCIQGDMLHDITIRHNTLVAPYYATSAIEGDCANCGSWVRVRWTVDGNLFSGGGYQLYCAKRSAESGSVVSNNRFGRDGWNHPAYATGCTDTAWSGNVADATGLSLPAA